MENSKIKHIFHEFVQRFELYLGCVLFLAMMVLLTIQVCSRYLGNAITWTEELSCIMLVWMSYLGFAGVGALLATPRHLQIGDRPPDCGIQSSGRWPPPRDSGNRPRCLPSCPRRCRCYGTPGI